MDLHICACAIIHVCPADFMFADLVRLIAVTVEGMVVVELAKLGAPWPLILICLLLGWSSNVPKSPIAFAGFFAGKEAQEKALRQCELAGHSHDIDRGVVCRYVVAISG